MKSKTRPKNPPSDLGARINMTAWKKHYVSTVAEDEPWPQREPGSNLGRIFVLLLLLHVFIIGAVVLYNIVSPKAPLASRTDPMPQTVTKSSTAPGVKTETDNINSHALVSTTPKPPVIAGGPNAPTPAPTPAKVTPAPTPAVAPASAKADGPQYYEVKSGDNVPDIATKLGVSAEDLVKMNSLDTTDLYPGRKLEYRKPSTTANVAMAPPVVPAAAASSVKAAKSQPLSLTSTTGNNAVTAPAKPKAETVKAADKEKDKDKEKSNSDNPPKPKMLVNTPSTSDDVPHAIPVKVQTNVEDQPPPAPKVKSHVEDAPPAKPKSETKTKNNDDPKPKKNSKTDKPESKTASKSDKSSKDKESTSKKKTVVVGSKDTLYSISKKYGVSVSALQKANNIKDPTLLRDGTKLVIPAKSKD